MCGAAAGAAPNGVEVGGAAADTALAAGWTGTGSARASGKGGDGGSEAALDAPPELHLTSSGGGGGGGAGSGGGSGGSRGGGGGEEASGAPLEQQMVTLQAQVTDLRAANDALARRLAGQEQVPHGVGAGWGVLWPAAWSSCRPWVQGRRHSRARAHTAMAAACTMRAWRHAWSHAPKPGGWRPPPPPLQVAAQLAARNEQLVLRAAAVSEGDVAGSGGGGGGAPDAATLAALRAKEELAAQLMDEGEKLSRRVGELEGTLRKLRAQVGGAAAAGLGGGG